VFYWFEDIAEAVPVYTKTGPCVYSVFAVRYICFLLFAKQAMQVLPEMDIG